jgi:hypothetical protein
VVDALNKRVRKMHETTISMYMKYLQDIIIEGIIMNQHYVQVKERLQKNNVQHKYTDYKDRR